MTLPHETLSQAWHQPDAFATSLLVLFLDQYGTEGLEWTPATIEMEVRDDTGVDLSPLSFDRLVTAIHILSTNAFFIAPADFARGCAVLAGHVPVEDHMILPGCTETAWGITEALLIQPPQPGKEEETFSPQVRGFIGECLDHEGLLFPPDVLALGLRSGAYLRVAHDQPPDVLKEAQARSQERSDAIKRFVHFQLVSLLEQLQRLPLANGKTDVVEPLLARIRTAV